MKRWKSEMAIGLAVFGRTQRSHMAKWITATIAMGLSCCAAAQAQSISWLDQDSYLGSGWWYLPKLAGVGDFVVVGQEETELGPLGYQTGSCCNGDYINWNYGNDDYTSGSNPSIGMVAYTFSEPCDYCDYYDFAVEVHQGGQESGAALWSHVTASSIANRRESEFHRWHRIRHRL